MAGARGGRPTFGVADETDIKHYGIKGMKWGVTRPDPGVSSQDAKDDKRLKKMQDKANKLEKQDKLKAKKLVDLKPSKDYGDANFVRNKAAVSGTKTLTNQDLRKAISRMNLERQYSELKAAEKDRSLIGRGRKLIQDLLLGALKDAAVSSVRPDSGGHDYSWGPPSRVVIDGSVRRPRSIGS